MDFCNSASYTISMSTDKAYILMGIKHSGKSTQGRFLADYLKCLFFDVDEIIQKNTGKSAREYYTENGPVAFMALEEAICEKLTLTYKGQQVVVSTGGGICDNAPAITHLRNLGKFVYIQVSEETACDRIMKKAMRLSDGTWKGLPAYINNRKPANEKEAREIFSEFYAARTEIYENIADITIPVKNASKEENFEELKTVLSI